MAATDSNFIFPYAPLESDRISLIPWNIDEHSEPYVQATKDHPELFSYLPWGPFPTYEVFNEWYTRRVVNSHRTQIIFAIYNKGTNGQPDELAGMVGCMSANADHAIMEIGSLIIIPKFQRTHVTTHAVGLLL